MVSPFPGQVTRLLAKSDDPHGLDELMSLVYTDLHQIAQCYFREEARGHTLQPTAVLHEAILRLFPPRYGEHRRHRRFQNRAHFFGAASRAIRRVLVDHSRKKRAKMRGGGWQRVDLESIVLTRQERQPDFLELEQALKRLEALNPMLGRIVELRFFTRLTEKETAKLLKMGQTTVRRHWSFAKAWLYRELQKTRG